VREALIKLAEDRLVEILPQRGSFITPIRLHEVLEARFIRKRSRSPWCVMLPRVVAPRSWASWKACCRRSGLPRATRI